MQPSLPIGGFQESKTISPPPPPPPQKKKQQNKTKQKQKQTNKTALNKNYSLSFSSNELSEHCP